MTGAGAALAIAAVVVGAGMMASSGMVAAQTSPAAPAAARFALFLDGMEIATFLEVSDITSEIEAPQYVLSGSTTLIAPQAQAPKLKAVTITLKRPVTASVEMWSWHDAALKSIASAQKSVSLVMYSPDGKPIVRYALKNAWPSKLTLSAAKTGGSGAAGSATALSEVVTLTADEIHRMAP